MLVYKTTTKFPVRTGKVKFGILSKEEIRRMSMVNVSDTTIYHRGLPNPYGINDHRMGTGHVGHIELSFPVYHIGFLDTIFKTLRCVCFLCSRLCLTAEEISQLHESDGKARFSAIYNMIKLRKKCVHCSMPQPNYIRQSLVIKADWPDIAWASESEREYCTRVFTQRDALSIFSNMTNKDVLVLGFNPDSAHPKHMIVQTVLVPPPVARPAIMASEGSRSRGQDDLTHKLQDINKRSIELRLLVGEDYRNIAITPDILEKINRLQFEVFTYMNNNIRGQKQSTQRSGAPTKSIIDRIKGKDGRIRGNLMGKRVDFSARSVITPDACMDVDEVGVPFKVAMSMTIPEHVTSQNIMSLTERVANGPGVIHGAENVITSAGVMINLAHCENRDKIRLQYGWVVERFLKNGDLVIFNRQPSLHKVGMMGHRVRLMPGLTFRLNLCCANPYTPPRRYNADFDGDEMNLHVPQSVTAQSDVGMLMMVSRQIISPQANRPIMGIVQDTLLGAHLLSITNRFFSRVDACHLVSHLRYARHLLPAPCVQHPRELWSGKQILSLLFPCDFTYGSCRVDFNDPEAASKPVIVDGNFLVGILSKASLGTSAGGIIDLFFRMYNSMRTLRFMSDIQRLVNMWLQFHGFNVSISDCVMSETGERRVKKRMDVAMHYAEDLMKEPFEKGTAEAAELEKTVVRILSKTLMQTAGIVDEELPTENAIRSMVNAGSKGNPINLSQICGCVGQQSIEGRRVFAEKGERTLTCFAEGDVSLAGHGFVQNSYALGLPPHEYFFHAMAGREGLVDTAVKTATTGYIQRRQVKSMEDHKVCFDGTIRSADDSIIDFSYGGDGMDATRLERMHLPILHESEASLAGRLTTRERGLAATAMARIRQCLGTETRVVIPFNPARIHATAAKAQVADALQATDEERCSMVQEHLAQEPSALYKLVILDAFCASRLEGLSCETIRRIFEQVGEHKSRAEVAPGEMMTLNTFHYAGVSCKNVTLGIPRLKEILDQTKVIKTPSNTIHFIKPLASGLQFAEFFAATLPLTRLSDIVSKCEFIYDPDLHTTVVASDAGIVAMNELLGNKPTDEASAYVVRLTLNQSIMNLRRITPPVVRMLLRNRLGKKAYVISSETNSVDWIVRIRFEYMQSMMQHIQTNKKEREGILCHRTMSVLLETVAICGHVDIQSAHPREIKHASGSEYVVDTMGCNLLAMSAAKCVDWYKSTSNDIIEIKEILGIEAAVHALYTELTVTISFDGTYVDPRHIMMIVNTMTRGGYIMPLSRHGINRMDTGPLLRCSFEETPDILCDAACFSEQDNGNGVSQNIMTGKMPAIGSGMCYVQMPTDAMQPRANVVHSNGQRRVMKSTMRSHAQMKNPDTGCMQMQTKNTRLPISACTAIEKPFCCTGADVVDEPHSIFSSDSEFAKPYTEEPVANVQNVEQRYRAYRPTSPNEG